MKTKHRNASKAKRKWQADPSTIYRTMGKFQDFTPEEKGQIVAPCRLAFERIRLGEGKSNDFICLSDACNVSMVRAEKISPLVESVCLVARDALLRCKSRFYKTGRWGFDGPALSAITDMLDVYEQMAGLPKPCAVNAMGKDSTTQNLKWSTQHERYKHRWASVSTRPV
jgi:hypothetical protein